MTQRPPGWVIVAVWLGLAAAAVAVGLALGWVIWQFFLS